MSLWEIPEELRHRGDVAGLIENGPERKDDSPAQPEPTNNVVEVSLFLAKYHSETSPFTVVLRLFEMVLPFQWL